MRLPRLILVACLIWGAAGCGSSDSDRERAFTDVFAQIRGLSGAQRQAKLEALAKKEGSKLSLYTSISGDDANAIADAFSDEFGIDVALYRAGGEVILPRLVEEAKAGFHGADVVRVNGLAMADLDQEKLLTRYVSANEAGLIAGTRYPGWVIDGLSSFAVGWNTKNVAPAERPRSWEDLADPKWKGRLGLEASDFDWYATLWKYWVSEGKTPAEADRLFDGIARNAVVVSGHSFLSELVSAGELDVGVNYYSRWEKTAADGAPIGVKPLVEPIFPEGQGVGLVKGARDPAAAILFYDWLLDKGAKILVDAGSEVARTDLIAAPGAERRVVDFRTLAPETQKWSQGYERLLRLGKKGPTEEG